jgi:hypothetical protein
MIIYFKKFLFLPVIFFLFFNSYSQDDYFDAKYIRNENFIYKNNIKTVLLYGAGNPLSMPIIQLHSLDKLMLSFDDLDADVKSYRYTVVHCDAYWNTSTIEKMEYLDGFYDDEIYENNRSINTLQPYTNYFLLFPTEYLRIKKSGNYILKVFVNTESDENVVFTRRFMVYDPKITVAAKVNKTSNLNDRYTKQQVDFSLITENYSIHDPYRDLHLVVRQNDRWDNVVTNIEPRRVLPNQLDYSLNEKIVFEGGNEFRYVDLKTVKYTTDKMATIDYLPDTYVVYLLADRNNMTREYYSESDINGKRIIESNQAIYNSSYEAEYAWVHFTLLQPKPLTSGNVYIMGELSGWQFSEENKMVYISNNRTYEVDLYLKQGYYNYCYAFLEDNKQVAEVLYFEGSHWETENLYTVFVYHREQGLFYDQLIGFTTISSVATE